MSDRKNGLILGIDPSLNGTGLFLLESPSMREVDRKFIPLNATGAPKLFGVDRLLYIADIIEKFISGRTIAHAGMEYGIFDHKNNSSIFNLGELAGVIQVILKRANISFHVFSPTSLKKFTAGHGHAEKSDMIEALKEKYGLHFEESEHDVADAAAAAALVSNKTDDEILNIITSEEKKKKKAKKEALKAEKKKISQAKKAQKRASASPP